MKPLVLLIALTFTSSGFGKVLTFSMPSGLYSNAFRLTVSTKTPGGVIRFTTDGSVPNVESPIWNGVSAVSNTIILRARLFQGTKPAGELETRTYLFPAAVLRQSGAGFPSNWGQKEGKSIPADYEMDPEIVFAPEYRDQMLSSLAAIPSVSIVLPTEDLFGERNGLYSHPEENGDEWERACHLEWIEPGKEGFSVEAGVRIQGGWNRRPEESPKHSFRIVFKKKYGPRKLHYAVFGERGPREFDNLILRAGCNNSWLHWSGVERRRGEFIRDQFMRDTLRDMGQPSAAGNFVHLYLNGLYWGVYNVVERPDDSFAAAHFGGASSDYDSFNADKLLSGTRDAWAELMRRVNQGVKTKADLAGVAELLDLENFADYMIANLYGANADWDRSSNWYAVRRRNPPGTFKFLIWDAERTLENPSDNTMDLDDDQSPTRIFHRLAENEEFRHLFARRAKAHLKGQGTLTPARCLERYRHWSDTLDRAILAESARWGDYRRDVHQYKEGPYELYTRQSHWRPEVQRLLESYFPKRSEIVYDLFKQKQLSE